MPRRTVDPWEKVAARAVADGDCLLWPGANNRGYGVVWDGSTRKNLYVHRVMWEHERGPIPDGLTIDHRVADGCTSTLCVNVQHMRLLTSVDNGRDGAERSSATLSKRDQTHCIHGHEFTPENTYHRADGKGRRICRACGAQRALRRYHERNTA